MAFPKQFVEKRTRVIWKEVNGRVYDGALGDFPGVAVTSATKRMGSCKFKRSFDGSLAVRKLTISKNHANKDALDDTIRHEVAHAAEAIIDGTRGHGRRWKKHARKCGADPTRTHDGPRETVDEEAVNSKTKYELHCEGDCGVIARRQQKSKTVKYPERYKCQHCGSALRVERGPAHPEKAAA